MNVRRFRLAFIQAAAPLLAACGAKRPSPEQLKLAQGYREQAQKAGKVQRYNQDVLPRTINEADRAIIARLARLNGEMAGTYRAAAEALLKEIGALSNELYLEDEEF